MLIGIDASRANRPHKSGTEWYSYYVIRWLAKFDAKNKYVLYSDRPLKNGLFDLTTPQHTAEISVQEKIEYDNDGFQIIKSPFNNFKGKVLYWPFSFFWTQGRLAMEMIGRRPDILFIPSHTLPCLHPKKSIVTIHDIGFERDRELYNDEQMGPEDKKKRKFVNLLVRLFTKGKYGANKIDYLAWSTEYALKKAKVIITPSEFSKKEMIDVYKADGKKINVIYNGYNRFLYKKIEDQNKIKAKLEEYGIESPFILYIGRLEKKKNTPGLIEAFAIFKEKHRALKHKLVLVGDASFGYDEVNYMIKEFALDNEVIMPGWVEEEDMPFLYNGATAFIFPSFYEGFGIPLLQAMACEIPIAASCAASIPEAVGEAALLFDPLNINEMAEAIYKIISDENLRSELIKRGIERVKNFSWEKCAKEVLEVINSL